MSNTQAAAAANSNAQQQAPVRDIEPANAMSMRGSEQMLNLHAKQKKASASSATNGTSPKLQQQQQQQQQHQHRKAGAEHRVETSNLAGRESAAPSRRANQAAPPSAAVAAAAAAAPKSDLALANRKFVFIRLFFLTLKFMYS